MGVAIIFEKNQRIPGTRLRYQEELPMKTKRRQARFSCDCGTVVDRDLHWVRFLNITSCGCYRSEVTAEKNRKHDNSSREAKTGAYRSWTAMKQRVKVNPGYANIQICDRWLNEDGFSNFMKDMGERPDSMSIERKDNLGNYEPGNCIWADRDTQSNNTSANVHVTISGVTKTIAQWCRANDIDYSVIKQRRRRGFSLEEAISKPLDESKRGRLRARLELEPLDLHTARL